MATTNYSRVLRELNTVKLLVAAVIAFILVTTLLVLMSVSNLRHKRDLSNQTVLDFQSQLDQTITDAEQLQSTRRTFSTDFKDYYIGIFDTRKQEWVTIYVRDTTTVVGSSWSQEAQIYKLWEN